MKKNNGESAHDAKENRKYIFVLLGCIAVAAAIGILLWQPSFTDTQSLSKYQYDTNEQTVSASDAVDNVPTDKDIQQNQQADQDDTQEIQSDNSQKASDNKEKPKTKEKTKPTAAQEENTPKFYLPMQNTEVSRAFCTDTLSYDKTMDDWRVHAAVDFNGKAGDTVTAIADATVEEIGNNVLYGTYIVLKHSDNIQSKYAGIADVCVKKGDSVNATQKIAVLGEPMPAEAKQGTHLHLEVTKDGSPIDIEKLAQ